MSEICKDGKVINYSLYGGDSIFKGDKKSPYKLETTYCTNCDNCKLYKRDKCLKVGRITTGNCPYGEKVVSVGSSPRTKSYYELKDIYYSRPEELRSCLNDVGDYMAEIDDTYIFLNVPYINIAIKDNKLSFFGPWVTIPFGYTRLIGEGLFTTGGVVVKKEIIKAESLKELLEYHPQDIGDNEIKDYQDTVVPLLKSSILRIFPDIAKELGIERVSHIGMNALLTTLKPDITFTIKGKEYYWDGEYITTDAKNVSIFSCIGEPVGKITLKASNTGIVKIEDDSWCNENTIYVR